MGAQFIHSDTKTDGQTWELQGGFRDYATEPKELAKFWAILQSFESHLLR